eukprot:278109-Prymnesium_polylepis.1
MARPLKCTLPCGRPSGTPHVLQPSWPCGGGPAWLPRSPSLDPSRFSQDFMLMNAISTGMLTGS